MVVRTSGQCVVSGAVKFWPSLTVDNVTCRVGDAVLLRLDCDAPRSRKAAACHCKGVQQTCHRCALYCADLVVIWEDRHEHWVEVRWLEGLEEAEKAHASSRPSLPEPKELYETDYVGEHEAHRIVGKINLVDEAGFRALQTAGKVTQGDYFCRAHWAHNKGRKLLLTVPFDPVKRWRRALQYSTKRDLLPEGCTLGPGGGIAAAVEYKPVQAAPDDPAAGATGGPKGKGKKRARPPSTDLADDFQRARDALSLSVVPSKMLGREEEWKNIHGALIYALQRGGSNKALYVCGMPGTGKTATVNSVVKQLKKDKNVPAFKFVEVNGMRLTAPQQLFGVLLSAITGESISSATKAKAKLTTLFSGKGAWEKRPLTLLLVDEMDYLVTNNQQVLFNLFDWPSRPQSRLVVVGISNTFDLPDRLHARIKSRLGLTTVQFGPYSTQQIKDIILHRLEGLNAIHPLAVKMAAAKVALGSGDLRRTLQLCQAALELRAAELQARKRAAATGTAETQTSAESTLVTLAHIQAAAKEVMLTNPLVKYVQSSPPLERLLLIAMVVQSRATGREVLTVSEIFDRMTGWCQSGASGLDFEPTRLEVCDMIKRLGSIGMVGYTRAYTELTSTVKVGVNLKDGLMVLREEPLVIQHLQKKRSAEQPVAT